MPLKVAVPAAVAVLFLIGVAISAGSREEGPAGPPAAGLAPGGPAAARRPVSEGSFLSRLVPRVRGTGPPPSVADLVARLPLERKVAQLFIVGFDGKDATAPIFGELRRRDLGGVVVEARNYTSKDQLAALTGEVRVVAGQARNVRPWILTAQEGGEFSELRGLPPAESPASLASSGAALAEAASTARALKPLGIDGVLGPDVDVGLADGGALGERTFSDDPVAVAGYAAATVGAFRRARFFSVAKHFPGLGSASQSTDQGLATVGLSIDGLARRDLEPFRAAIRAGAPGIMIGHGLYPADDFGLTASLSRTFATDLLRGQLGFRGVTIADDLASPALKGVASVPEAAVMAIAAGVDLVFVSGGRREQESAYRAVLDAARKGRIPPRRIDEAFARSLSAKQQFGVIP